MKMSRQVMMAVMAVCWAVVAFGGTPPLETNRVETLRLFAENVYGVRPEFKFECKAEVVKTEKAAELKATRKDVRINTMTPLGLRTFTAVVFLPERTDGAKAPCFVYVSFERPDDLLAGDAARDIQPWHWPVREILARGFATVAFDYQEAFPDRTEEVAAWGRSSERAPNGWGAISAWALAASRVMD